MLHLFSNSQLISLPSMSLSPLEPVWTYFSADAFQRRITHICYFLIFWGAFLFVCLNLTLISFIWWSLDPVLWGFVHLNICIEMHWHSSFEFINYSELQLLQPFSLVTDRILHLHVHTNVDIKIGLISLSLKVLCSFPLTKRGISEVSISCKDFHYRTI